MNITLEHYAKARMTAVLFHGDQKYGDEPYIRHCEEVCMILHEFGVHNITTLCAGMLHDTLEDTALTFDTLESVFGYDVAHLVWLVTDKRTDLARRDRHALTYPLIVNDVRAIHIKLADRIANMRRGNKNDMYVREYDQFVYHLYRPFALRTVVESKMWDELDKLVALYNTTQCNIIQCERQALEPASTTA